MFANKTFKFFLQVFFFCVVIGSPLLSAERDPFNTETRSFQPLTFTTIHGPLTVNDPLAIELIQSPVMQRLDGIHQYGVMEKIHPGFVRYTRFQHCINVYKMLCDYRAPRKQQIAGLLHDVSHTVFSHLTDMLFLKSYAGQNYQDIIHEDFLRTYKVEEILKRYNYSIKDILPDNKEFRMLERKERHVLSADRIEYNIYAGYLTGALTLSDIQELYTHLHFDGQEWYFDNLLWAGKLANISIDQTLNTWSSPENMVVSKWICQAIQILFHKRLINKEGIHYSYSDAQLWKKLETSCDLHIQELMEKAKSAKNYFRLVDDEKEADEVFKFKSRALDPLIMKGQKLYPLTTLSKSYSYQFEQLKHQAQQGWRIQYFLPYLRKGLRAL